MNRNYELVVILDADLKTEDQDNSLSKIKKIISDSDGKIITVKEWGKKEFTYPIAKKRAGIYHIFNFSLSTSGTPSLKQKISMEESILRYLLIAKDGKASLEGKKEKANK